MATQVVAISRSLLNTLPDLNVLLLQIVSKKTESRPSVQLCVTMETVNFGPMPRAGPTGNVESNPGLYLEETIA